MSISSRPPITSEVIGVLDSIDILYDIYIYIYILVFTSIHIYVYSK